MREVAGLPGKNVGGNIPAAGEGRGWVMDSLVCNVKELMLLILYLGEGLSRKMM